MKSTVSVPRRCTTTKNSSPAESKVNSEKEIVFDNANPKIFDRVLKEPTEGISERYISEKDIKRLEDALKQCATRMKVSVKSLKKCLESSGINIDSQGIGILSNLTNEQLVSILSRWDWRKNKKIQTSMLWTIAGASTILAGLPEKPVSTQEIEAISKLWDLQMVDNTIATPAATPKPVDIAAALALMDKQMKTATRDPQEYASKLAARQDPKYKRAYVGSQFVDNPEEKIVGKTQASAPDFDWTGRATKQLPRESEKKNESTSSFLDRHPEIIKLAGEPVVDTPAGVVVKQVSPVPILQETGISESGLVKERFALPNSSPLQDCQIDNTTILPKSLDKVYQYRVLKASKYLDETPEQITKILAAEGVTLDKLDSPAVSIVELVSLFNSVSIVDPTRVRAAAFVLKGLDESSTDAKILPLKPSTEPRKIFPQDIRQLDDKAVIEQFDAKHDEESFAELFRRSKGQSFIVLTDSLQAVTDGKFVGIGPHYGSRTIGMVERIDVNATFQLLRNSRKRQNPAFLIEEEGRIPVYKIMDFYNSSLEVCSKCKGTLKEKFCLICNKFIEDKEKLIFKIVHPFIIPHPDGGVKLPSTGQTQLWLWEPEPVIVQINGVTQGDFFGSANLTTEELQKKALEIPKVVQALGGKSIQKVVVIQSSGENATKINLIVPA